MIQQLKSQFSAYGENFLSQLPIILIGLVLFFILFLIGRLFKKLFLNRFSKRIHDKLLSNFLGNLIYWFFIVIGFSLFLTQIGLEKAVTGLLAGAGVTAIILGFAFKDIGENLLSGIMMAFSRPFNIGDVIEINGYNGTVKNLNLRNTHLRTFNGRDIYIPNSNMIKNPLVNFTQDGLLRHEFIIGIGYNEAIPQVIGVIDEVLSEVKGVVQSKSLKPFVTVSDFATSTINLKTHFWINSKDFIGSTVILRSEVMRLVIAKLMEHKFDMPADILELKIYQEDKAIPIKIIKEQS